MKTLLLLSAFAAGSASSALAAETRVLDCGSVDVYAVASPAGPPKLVARDKSGAFLDDVERFNADGLKGFRGIHGHLRIGWTTYQPAGVPAGQVHAVLERDDRVSPGLCEFLPE